MVPCPCPLCVFLFFSQNEKNADTHTHMDPPQKKESLIRWEEFILLAEEHYHVIDEFETEKKTPRG